VYQAFLSIFESDLKNDTRRSIIMTRSLDKINMSVWYTRHNGSRPFKVEILKNPSNHEKTAIILSDKFDTYSGVIGDILMKPGTTVKISEFISKGMRLGHPNKYSQIRECVAKRVMIGESKLNDMTAHSGGYGSKFRGSGILLELQSSYIHICKKLTEFIPKCRINTYEAPVGNALVVYPYAVDEKNNYYLFSEDVILLFGKKWNRIYPTDNPYGIFYYECKIVNHPAYGSDTKYPSQIEKCYICIKDWDGMFNLIWKPNPEAVYSKWLKCCKKNIPILKFKYFNKPLCQVNKEEFIKIIEDYGAKLGFVGISSYTANCLKKREIAVI
jgi:hypothetical protein